MSKTGQVHLVIGPVGAGKTSFVGQLCRDRSAVGFNLDAWMAQLFGDDPRPAEGRIEWYVERRDRCIEQIWSVARDVLGEGLDVVLEIGMIARADRAAFYQRVAGCGRGLVVYVLDAPRDVRRQRVVRRNQDRGETFAMEVPLPFFELASDMWEPPGDDERSGRDVRDVVDVTDADGSVRWLYD